MAVTNSPRLGLPRWSAGTDLHPNRAEWDAQQGLLDDLVAIDYEVATYADRPEPKRGIYMWVVDEQRLYRATSTGWMTAAKIGGGGRGTQIVIGANSSAVEGASAYAARADHTHTIPLATSAVDGAMPKADKAKLDTSTASATNNAVVRRDSSGGSAFTSATLTSAPSAAAHAARKDYVDAGDNARFPFGLDAGTGSINTILNPGQYQQASSTPVITSNGYPIGGSAGSLTVTKFGSGSWVIQEWVEWSSRRMFLRATNGGSSSWSEWREFAGTETATGSADGLMSKVDKSILDSATITALAGVLVKRDSNAQINVPSIPTSTNHASSKSYTDAAAASAASSAVGAIPLATASVDGLMPKADKATMNAATNNSTASTLAKRDSGGRIAVGAPVASNDAATKGYTDTTSASAASSAASAAVSAIPTATTSVDGLMPKSDKAKLDGATQNGSNSTLMLRSSAGGTIVTGVRLTDTTPSGVDYAVRKDYVDGLIAQQVTAATPLTTRDLDSIAVDGNYVQTSSDNATVDRNYPISAAGLLVVSSYSTFAYQTYTVYSGTSVNANKIYNRGKYVTSWSAWREVGVSDLATTSNDGLMPKTDKALLDSATTSNVAGSLVQRANGTSTATAFGRISVSDPVLDGDATNKAYVDDAVRPKSTIVSANVDMNALTTTGDYYHPNRTQEVAGTNQPTSDPALIEVRQYGSNGELLQRWTQSRKVYIRQYTPAFPSGMFWTAWYDPTDFEGNVQAGRTRIVPSAANTPTSLSVSFNRPFPSGSTVIVTAVAETTVPGTTVTGVAVNNTSRTGFDLYITRINTTGTYVQWIATLQSS